MNSAFNMAELWDQISDQYRSEVAIDGATGSLSYGELDDLSERLAAYFGMCAVRPESVIAFMSSKNSMVYAAMLAALKIGAIYVNLDPSSPISRLQKILDVCQPTLLCVDADSYLSITAELSMNGGVVKNLLSIELPPYPSSRPDRNFINWFSPAYIMFTSGSTGVPKGVTISHGGLLSFVSWSRDFFKISPQDRFAQSSPIYFDNSVFDFYTALFSGASLIPINAELLKSPVKLVEYVRDLNCTIWFSVPSLFVYLLSLRVLGRIALPCIRHLIFGGEGFPKRELLNLYQAFNRQATLTNVYGPTEGTCICSAYKIKESDFIDLVSLAPLGKMNPNFGYKIVSSTQGLMQAGDKGELWISGPNLALGYFNDADRTSQQFVQEQNKFGGCCRWYKTGDIVFESDGLLWFAGRVDNQIKHMGYRIELEEIEAAINSIEGIEQSGVIYDRHTEKHGRIIAFFQSSQNVAETDIVTALRAFLPSYMIPQVFVKAVQLPKNRNGKIDRNYLKKEMESLETFP